MQNLPWGNILVCFLSKLLFRQVFRLPFRLRAVCVYITVSVGETQTLIHPDNGQDRAVILRLVKGLGPSLLMLSSHTLLSTPACKCLLVGQ